MADESGASGCGSNDSLNWSRLVIGSAAHSSNRDYHDSQRATDVVQSRARRIRRIQSVSGSATEIRPRGGLFHAFVGFYRKPPCAGGCNGKEEVNGTFVGCSVSRGEGHDDDIIRLRYIRGCTLTPPLETLSILLQEEQCAKYGNNSVPSARPSADFSRHGWGILRFFCPS